MCVCFFFFFYFFLSTDLDANALLDVFLSGWDSLVSRLFNNKDPRTMAFELKRHRNKWAHESTLSAREAYRAIDAVEQFLVYLSAKVELREEIHKVHMMLEDVILEMAMVIDQRRRTEGHLPRDFDGDVEMVDCGDD